MICNHLQTFSPSDHWLPGSQWPVSRPVWLRPCKLKVLGDCTFVGEGFFFSFFFLAVTQSMITIPLASHVKEKEAITGQIFWHQPLKDVYKTGTSQLGFDVSIPLAPDLLLCFCFLVDSLFLYSQKTFTVGWWYNLLVWAANLYAVKLMQRPWFKSAPRPFSACFPLFSLIAFLPSCHCSISVKGKNPPKDFILSTPYHFPLTLLVNIINSNKDVNKNSCRLRKRGLLCFLTTLLLAQLTQQWWGKRWWWDICWFILVFFSPKQICLAEIKVKSHWSTISLLLKWISWAFLMFRCVVLVYFLSKFTFRKEN